MDAQYFSFYIILSNYVRSILFYQNKDHNVRQIRFLLCIKMYRYKRQVCKRKIFSGRPNTNTYTRARVSTTKHKRICKYFCERIITIVLHT